MSPAFDAELVPLGFAAAGALVVAGLLVLLSSLRRCPDPGPSAARVQGWRVLLGAHRRRVAVAAGAALLALVVTRWPVAALAAGGLTLAWPALLGGARSERRAAARLEALAIWTESLRDTIAGAVGLEQAIIATARAAPDPISAQLRLLADRLRVRVPLEAALRRLADDLDDTSADLIVAALILNSRLRGPGLRQVLTSLSESARAELEMRGRVGAGRAATRRSVQIVVAVTVGFVLLLVLFNPSYVEPYRHPAGQAVLAVVVGFFAAGFFWLRRLSSYDLPARFLTGAGAVRGGRVTGVLLAGAVAGLGVLLLVGAVQRPGTRGADAAGALAGLDRDRRHLAGANQQRASGRVVLGRRLAGWLADAGLSLPLRLRADLALTGRTVEDHLVASLLAGLAGGLVMLAVCVPLATGQGDIGLPGTTPLWAAAIGALVGALLPSVRVVSRAGAQRRDFQHVVGSFLDLVALNLAGGRGVPEALNSASAISDGWVMVRLRETLEAARWRGITQWQALGELGARTGVPQLRDLSAALELVADDGAKVRESLAARAASLRRSELADAEGRAQARSQSMLVAQLLLAVGFLIFLIYPAITRVLTA